MADTPPDDLWCSTLSRELGEQLFGSAPTHDVWLLLEYTQPWGAKVLPDSDLSNDIKARLNALLANIPKSNILFIKQQFKRVGKLAFYVALPHESHPRLYEFALNGYNDLLTLDVAAVAAQDSKYDAHWTHDPLYLVCVNARRDRCCAKYGLPLYRELAMQAGSRVWQCSHIGGHRFAPTTLFFPHGINYGRIEPGEAPTLADEYRHGRLNLERLRGRVCYDSVTQAADYYLRAQLELDGIDALRHTGTRALDSEKWRVQFQAGAETHAVELQKSPVGVETQNSCGAAEKVPLMRFELLSHALV